MTARRNVRMVAARTARHKRRMDARPMTGRDWTLLLTLGLLWGGSFFFVGLAVREWPALTIVFARVTIAAAALWAIVAVTGLTVRRDRATFVALLGMAVLNNAVPFALIVWAQGALPAGTAAVLNAAMPFWSVLVMHLAAVERLTAARVAGAVAGFAGVSIMAAGGLRAGLPALAVGAVLLASLSYAVSNLFGRRLQALGVPPLVAAAGQCGIASALLLPQVLALEPVAALPAPSWSAMGAVLALALLSTALAYLVFFRLLASAGPTNVSLVTLLAPVAAVLLGALFLDETLGPRHALGMAAIATGLALIDGRLPARLRARLRPA